MNNSINEKNECEQFFVSLHVKLFLILYINAFAIMWCELNFGYVKNFYQPLKITFSFLSYSI